MASLIIANLIAFSQQGYLDSPLTWELPEGGQIYNGHEQGFLRPRDFSVISENIGTMLWDIKDMDGDGMPDLVVTAVLDAESSKTFRTANNKQYWKVYKNLGDSYDTIPTEWLLPPNETGLRTKTIQLGFLGIQRQELGGLRDVGSQLWDLQDINGDNKPDLILTGERDADTIKYPYHRNFNNGSWYWKVYLNNGSGFNNTVINWNLPEGGFMYNTTPIGFLFYRSDIFKGGNLPEGSQGWDLKDLNGDKRPDLIICGEITKDLNPEVYNISNPYWKVHINNGSGFNAPITWNVPNRGERIDQYTPNEDSTDWIITARSHGLNKTIDNSIAYEHEGSESWDLIDLNGDSKLDLIFLMKRVNNIGISYGNQQQYWEVYFNNGKGFDTQKTNWTLPIGGSISQGVKQGFNSWYDLSNSYNDTASEIWYTMHFNGDEYPDLVVYSSKNSDGNSYAFGQNKNQWKVYENNASGFKTEPIYWEVPKGGQITNNDTIGFNSSSYVGGIWASEVVGSQYWGSIDMNGDNKIDLVVSSEMQSDTIKTFNSGFPHWKVYLNDIPTGVDQYINTYSNTSVYPNISSHEITFSTTNHTSGKITIVTPTGEIVKSQEFEGTTTSINISDITNGLYFIGLSDQKDSWNKFIKQ